MSASRERQTASSTDRSDGGPVHTALPAILRIVWFFGFWLILTDAEPGDLAAGGVAAVAAAWASPRCCHDSIGRCVLSGFLDSPCSSLAGVRSRASTSRGVPSIPGCRCAPGIVTYHPLLPPGPNQNTFLTVMSLMPGTLPAGAMEGGGIAIHCLDVAQPVTEQLAAEESLFVRALGGAQDND